MPFSMTGFGRGEAVLDDTKVVTEVTGLNHRFLDISIRLPGELAGFETRLRRTLKNRLVRGRVTVTVDIARTDISSPATASIDTDLARRYVERLHELSDRINVKNDVSVMGVVNLPGVMATASSPVDPERMERVVSESLDRALDAFTEVRAAEGAVLCEDLEAGISHIYSVADAIEQRIPAVVEAYRARLTARVSELSELAPVDPDRVAVEVALFADKCDVNEEVVRLRSHLERFLETLTGHEPAAGRLLDFLCQEMHREITTIGAKGRDADISHLVVEAKGELEKVREQVQNIE